MIVDNGGFFPEEGDSLYRDKAWFLMDGMVLVGVDAAGMSEKELKYGRGWLLAQLKRTRLPMVCANVWDKQTKKTLVPQYVIVKKGNVNVGVFGLTSDKVDLGPARDSLTLEDPALAAKRAVDEMRKKGATVIVLLSSLGKVESEDLVTGVDGEALRQRLRTGTVWTDDDRNWELRFSHERKNINLSRAIAVDMESGTIAAQGFRLRVPYGTLLCVSDKPLHGEIKLPGAATAFYETAVAQHLEVGLEALSLLQNRRATLHSRKLRSFDEPPFR